MVAVPSQSRSHCPAGNPDTGMPKLFRILCVEDTPELMEDVSIELRDAGYEVIEATDGSAALGAFNSDKPDLVLCDIQLPKIDGLAFLAALRAMDGPGRDIPAIVMSAYSDADLRDRANRAGIQGFLIKPIDYDQLLALIESTLALEDARELPGG